MERVAYQSDARGASLATACATRPMRVPSRASYRLTASTAPAGEPTQAMPTVGADRSKRKTDAGEDVASGKGRKESLFGDLSMTQLAAGALAASTSALFSSQIGIAGTIIGVAVGSVVSAVASQLYKRFFAASAEKLRSAGANLVDSARSRRTEGGASAGDSDDGVLISDVSDLMDNDEIRSTAAQRRKKATQRKVLAVSAVSAIVAVVVTAGVVSLATSGEGLGPKTEPLFASSSVSETTSVQKAFAVAPAVTGGTGFDDANPDQATPVDDAASGTVDDATSGSTDGTQSDQSDGAQNDQAGGTQGDQSQDSAGTGGSEDDVDDGSPDASDDAAGGAGSGESSVDDAAGSAGTVE